MQTDKVTEQKRQTGTLIEHSIQCDELDLCLHPPVEVDGRTIIGHDLGTQFELIGDAVFAVDPTGRLQARFVNSNVDAFVSFIDAYKRRFEHHNCHDTNVDDDAYNEQFQARFTADLRAMDSQAFDNEENWWALVVEYAGGY